MSTVKSDNLHKESVLFEDHSDSCKQISNKRTQENKIKRVTHCLSSCT